MKNVEYPTGEIPTAVLLDELIVIATCNAHLIVLQIGSQLVCVGSTITSIAIDGERAHSCRINDLFVLGHGFNPLVDDCLPTDNQFHAGYVRHAPSRIYGPCLAPVIWVVSRDRIAVSPDQVVDSQSIIRWS